MKFNSVKYFSVGVFITLFSCQQSDKKAINLFSGIKKDSTIKYAKRFSIARHKNYTLVFLFGNKQNLDTTATYIIYNNNQLIDNTPQNIITIKYPCIKIAALSSIYANMLFELGEVKKIAAIDNRDYINNKEIIANCKNGKIAELSKGTEINLEQTIKLNPDIVFTFGMGDPKKDVNTKLVKAKIPVAISLDHLEETPLARAEWIKFFACFVNQKNKADSIFKHVEKNYNYLQQIGKKTKQKPTVFNEIKTGDTWYIPGGKSYVAKLLNDAGANYLWKEDVNSGSLPLSFEQVYFKAKKADFWINLGLCNSKTDLLNYEPRYTEFKAFKTGNIFNNNKNINSKGYSDYWETGIIYPNKVLNDLLIIFHPELKAQLDGKLYYYKQLK
jgi:iron complex transport system substrate-binding protein